MEPPGGYPPDKLVLHQQQQLQYKLQPQHKPNLTLNIQPTTAALATSAQQQQQQLTLSVRHGGLSSSTTSSSGSQHHVHAPPHHQQTIERLSRPLAFDKMESLVREMQDPETGVPVRQQKMFLTSIPYAFMGYDLIEWIMDRLSIEESEALNISNQLCLHGYFFPVNDTKTLVVKDDSSLYRFQTPYYWPWQHRAPDNVEYAIYLVKRSLRNKQRHALEDYEAEALASLHKNLKGKWDFISMQAEEQVRLAKERKKGDKIVGDSQERAFWRVHRPPPAQFTPLEPCPVPSRDRQGVKPKKKTVDDIQREVDYLKKSLNRTRMKMSQACETLVSYSETFAEYDFFLQPALPSNPWVTDDTSFWQLNSTFVETPTEKRVKRWAISIEELVYDPTGLQEFTTFLEKEYSHENIRFWTAVNQLRRSAQSQVPRKVTEIYEEFLKPGAPCEINIDGKTMEIVQKGIKNPSRFTFDAASEHIYMLLLKKDCYPRFIRSEHYKNLLATGIQPSHKKRFFNFGGVGGAKKKMTAALSSQANLGGSSIGGTSGTSNMAAPPPGHLARRRGSDRSLTGSAHELAVIGVKDTANKVPHSHSQSNLSEIPYREGPKAKPERLATTVEVVSSAVCPWDTADDPPAPAAPTAAPIQLSVCPWDQDDEPPPAPPATPAVKTVSQRLTSTSSDISDVSDRMQNKFGIRQNTVDSGESSNKRLMANFTEQRRASMTYTPRISEYQFSPPSKTPSPTVLSKALVSAFKPAACEVASKVLSQAATFDATDADDETAMLKRLVITERSESPAPSAKTDLTPAATPSPPTIMTLPTNNDNLDEILQKQSQQQKTAVQIELMILVEGNDATSFEPGHEAQADPVSIQCEEEPPTATPKTRTPLALTPTIQVHECPPDEAPSSPSPPPPLPREVSPMKVDIDPVSEDLPIERPSVAAVTSVVAVVMPTVDVISDSIESNERPPDLVIPPPLPPVGPMEEELQIREEEEEEDESVPQEELSPTTDEYQEGLQFGAEGRSDVYDYDIVDEDSAISSGCIAPAPTPAPALAPLAEIDMDPVDDETTESLETKPTYEETADEVEAPPLPVIAEVDELKKKRRKRNSDGKKASSVEEKEKISGEGGAKPADADAERNTVCPWEDENVTTSGGTFVKTYATLGYL